MAQWCDLFVLLLVSGVSWYIGWRDCRQFMEQQKQDEAFTLFEALLQEQERPGWYRRVYERSAN